jgi:hypothetical protein
MQALRSIEAQFDITWRTSVAVVELGTLVTWVVEDIDEQAMRHVAGKFYVNFLMR